MRDLRPGSSLGGRTCLASVLRAVLICLDEDVQVDCLVGLVDFFLDDLDLPI